MNRLTMGILAHVDAGKTTLSEAIMFRNGNIRKLGRVDHGDAFLDNYALEKERGITIYSKQAVFDLPGHHVTLLDTPGHVDFSPEMERTLKVLDVAVLVISATDGVQSHTETLWRLLKSYHIPVFLFVNKMDQTGADREAVLTDLRARLDDNCISFDGSYKCHGIFSFEDEILEEIAVSDETILDSYMETGEILCEDIAKLIERRRIFPVFFGSALKLQGVDDLLAGLDIFTGKRTYPREFGAKIYKITRDIQGNRLTHMKITGGSLKVKEAVLPGEKADQIRVYSGSRHELLDEAVAGDIVAVTGPVSTYAGQGLGREKDYVLQTMTPVITRSILLPEGTDATKAMGQFKELLEEEPALHISWDAHHEEIHAQLMGEVQTEILQAMIEERYGMKVSFGPEQIMYRETIMDTVIGIGHYEPLRHYAEVQLRLEPGKPGSGITCASELSVDDLDLNWQRLIMTHILEKDHVGVLCGMPITDIRITLVAGKAHLKHTEGGDFRQATYRAIRQGLMQAESRLLEPWYDLNLEIPMDCMGKAMTDIRYMGGECEPVEMGTDQAVLKGKAPAAGIKDYQKEVLSYTGGRGRLSLSFRGYEGCHNEAEVIGSIDYFAEGDMDNPCGSIFCHHGAGFYIPWKDVPSYAHLSVGRLRETENEKALTTVLLKEPAKSAAASSGPVRGNTAGSYGLEKDLEDIYRREFGNGKQESDRYSGYRKDSANVPDSDKKPIVKSEKYYKKARKKPDCYLLVDGYNIIFAWDELKALGEENLDAARSKLMDILSNYQGYVGCKLILVFDAYKLKGHDREVMKYHNIYVVYTKEAETADQYIEKTTHELGKDNEILVATSDHLEQIIVMGQGASRISADDFYEEVERVSEEIRRVEKERRRNKGNYLFDYMDEDTADRVENVRLGKECFDQP